MLQFTIVRAKIVEPNVRLHFWIKAIESDVREGCRPVPKVVDLSRDGKRPVKPKIALVTVCKLQILPPGHATEVPGKIGTRGECKVKGTPKLGIYLHELIFSISLVTPEFNHCHTVPA